jgi:pilus assembly protein CpaE
MDEGLSVVIIDNEDESRGSTDKIVKKHPNVLIGGTAEDLTNGFRLIQDIKPNLVILSLDPDVNGALSMVEKINQNFPGIHVFVSSSDRQPDVILRAMRSGAKEFLVRPIKSDELTAALEREVQAWDTRQRESSSPGKVITVFCSKGGYGTTTVAVNLATSLAPLIDEPVILLDLDLEAGDVATYLGLTPKYTISNVTSNLPRMDHAYLQTALARHASGVYVLAEPAHLEEVETITPTQIRDIINMLRSMGGIVIVDAKKSFDDRTLMALDLSDVVLLVTVLSIPGVRNTQRTLEVFHRLGFSQQKVKLLVNRFLPSAEIKVQDLERTLNYPVSYEIVNDFPSAMASINRGQPISEVAPTSKLSVSFWELARKIGGVTNLQRSKVKKGRLFGKLFK